MAYGNTSSAYDFSSLQAAPVRQPRRQMRLVENRSPKRRISSLLCLQNLCAFAVVVTLVSLMIFNQVRLNEITGEINEVNSELTILKSDYVRLTSKLEATVSLRSVETQAKDELGLARIDKYQTEYVNLYEQDKIIVTQAGAQENWADNFKLSVNRTINGFKEYIGVR